MILTREDLHRQVWARPMPKAAHDLGVTTAELERLCKILDVPFPYSGSWRKDAPLDGHARPLPRARPGRPDAVELDRPEAAPPRPPSTPDPPTDASTSGVAPSPAPSCDADARPEPADDRPEDPLDRRWSLIHRRLEEALARAGHMSQVVDGSHGFDVKGQFLSYWLREGYTRTRRPLTPDEARDPWKTAGGRDHVFEERMTGRLILDDDLDLTKGEARLSLTRPKTSFASSMVWAVADPLENRPDPTEEFTFDARQNLTPNWTAKLSGRYDFVADRGTVAGMGLEFLNECVRLDVSLSRRFTSSTSVTPTTSFDLAVDLVGFGGGAKAGPARTCRR